MGIAGAHSTTAIRNKQEAPLEPMPYDEAFFYYKQDAPPELAPELLATKLYGLCTIRIHVCHISNIPVIHTKEKSPIF
jgi:hypothetical protein